MKKLKIYIPYLLWAVTAISWAATVIRFEEIEDVPTIEQADESGQVTLTLAGVPAKSEVKWSITPQPKLLLTSQDGRTVRLIATGRHDATVLIAKGYELLEAKATIGGGKPVPPPIPPPEPPKPDPVVEKIDKLQAVIVFDSHLQDEQAEYAEVLNSKELRELGPEDKYAFFLVNKRSEINTKYATMMQGNGPTLILTDQDGKVLLTEPLPPTVRETKAAIRRELAKVKGGQQ